MRSRRLGGAGVGQRITALEDLRDRWLGSSLKGFRGHNPSSRRAVCEQRRYGSVGGARGNAGAYPITLLAYWVPQLWENSRSHVPRGIMPGEFHPNRCYSAPAGEKRTTIFNSDRLADSAVPASVPHVGHSWESPMTCEHEGQPTIPVPDKYQTQRWTPDIMAHPSADL